MHFNIVDIAWEGPFKVSYNRDSETYGLEGIDDDLLEGHGFYQIYGRHPVYGPDVLLYIGKTEPNDVGTRSFRRRIQEHLSWRFYDHVNLSVYFGVAKLDSETTRNVESVLIATHMPALNSKHIDRSLPEAKNLLVRNTGFIGSLESACIGYWELG